MSHTFRRRLVGLLCLALVPVLLLTHAGVAEAVESTKYSGQTRAEFGEDLWGWNQWYKCELSAVYAVSGNAQVGFLQTVKQQEGDCDTGIGVNLGGADFEFDFNGLTPNGAVCSSTASTTAANDGTEGLPPSQAGYGFTPVPFDDLCTVDTLCWSFHQDTYSLPGASLDKGDCQSFKMGIPQLPGSTTVKCDQGTIYDAVGKVSPSSLGAYYNGGYNRLQYEVWGAPATMNNIEGWRMNIVVKNGPEHAWANQTWPRLEHPGWAPAGTYYQDSDPGSAYQDERYGWTYAGIAIWWDQGRGQAGPSGRGYNNPANCAFYFGEKNGLVPEDPFQTFDDPTGPGAADLDAPHNTTEPDDSAPEVEPPSLVDPPTANEPDAACSGFEAVVCAVSGLGGLLKRLWEAVLGIAGAILDGLKALFIPSPGAWNLGDIRDQAKGRAPFSLLADLGDSVSSVKDSYSTNACGSFDPTPDIPGDTIGCGSLQTFTGGAALVLLVKGALLSFCALGIYKRLSGMFENT